MEPLQPYVMGQHTEVMPGAERDDDSGQYTETYDTDEFLAAIRDSEGMTGTQDVADAVGCEYETAYKRLRKLAEEGTVDSQKVANARVWVLPDEVTDGGTQQPRDSRESGETPSAKEADESVTPDTEPTSTAENGGTTAGDSDADDWAFSE